MENNIHNANKSEEKFSVCPVQNWFCALGHAELLTQTKVKHVPVKLHKRLSCLSGKLSPSVALLLTASILWCLVHTLCPPSLSLSHRVVLCHSSSFPNTPTPVCTVCALTAQLSWAGQSRLLTVIVTVLIKTLFGGWELNFILGRSDTTCVSF